MHKKSGKNEEKIYFPSDDAERLELLLKNVVKEYIASYDKTIRQDVVIPLNIFSKKLSPLETVVKYLKENKEYGYKKIAGILKRDHNTVWQAYRSSAKKEPKKLEDRPSRYFIPVKILSDRRFSILESVVSYLKEHHNIGFNKIATMLRRDQRTVWTVYNRVKNKR